MKTLQFLSYIGLALFCALVPVSCAKNGASSGSEYTTSTIQRGSIEKTVSSSGTIEPVSSVSVLAQMSGVVEKVLVDYNDRVTKGQTLAVLNTDMLRLQETEQKASVAKAKANYELQLLNYQNQTKLAEKGLISDYDLKSAKTSLDVLEAELSSAEAALAVIETEIHQYAYINSPISGVVLERDADVGQSVVEGSSSNSSAIFTIAEDLTSMRIEATVDEVDIASITKDQKVKFTVEALPGKTFTGTVEQIRLIPETSDSVVSYYVIIGIDNTGGSLLPGMTAEVDFIVADETDVLLVPNAALRFEPSALTSEQIAEKKQTALAALTASSTVAGGQGTPPADAPQGTPPAGAPQGSTSATDSASTGTTEKQSGLTSLMMGGGGMGGPGMGGPGGGPGGPGSQGQKKTSTEKSSSSASVPETKYLWYRDDAGEFQAIAVTVGVTDGTNTAVTTTADLEGKSIVVKEKVS